MLKFEAHVNVVKSISIRFLLNETNEHSAGIPFAPPFICDFLQEDAKIVSGSRSNYPKEVKVLEFLDNRPKTNYVYRPRFVYRFSHMGTGKGTMHALLMSTKTRFYYQTTRSVIHHFMEITAPEFSSTVLYTTPTDAGQI